MKKKKVEDKIVEKKTRDDDRIFYKSFDNLIEEIDNINSHNNN